MVSLRPAVKSRPSLSTWSPSSLEVRLRVEEFLRGRVVVVEDWDWSVGSFRLGGNGDGLIKGAMFVVG